MTDILTAQSAIKSRHPLRDPSGRFAADIHAQITAKLLHERLLRDTKAREHARGIVWEHGHFHALPGAKLIETVSPVDEVVDPLPLFHAQRCAA